MGAEAEWCGQCYALRRAAQPAAPPQLGGGTPWGTAPASTITPVRAVPVKAVAPATIKTRWRKTPTTFGPLGRILATIGLVVPEIFFVVVGILTGGFTIAGALIWGAILMPWGLKDTWRAGTMLDPNVPASAQAQPAGTIWTVPSP